VIRDALAAGGPAIAKPPPVMAATSGEVAMVMEFMTDKKVRVAGVIPSSGRFL
jgi:hypothetical protein